MRAHRVAEKTGSFMAPRSFVEMLRRETGDRHLDCWWDDECQVFAENPRKDFPERPGCWVIWKSIPQLENVEIGGVAIGISRRVYVDVYKLDGLWDRPMVLGHWVADVLNQCDLTKRGGHARLSALDDARQRAHTDEDDISTALGKDMAKEYKKLIAKAVEDTGGFKSNTLQERIANEKRLTLIAEARRSRVEARGRDARLYR